MAVSIAEADSSVYFPLSLPRASALPLALRSRIAFLSLSIFSLTMATLLGCIFLCPCQEPPLCPWQGQRKIHRGVSLCDGHCLNAPAGRSLCSPQPVSPSCCAR